MNYEELLAELRALADEKRAPWLCCLAGADGAGLFSLSHRRFSVSDGAVAGEKEV